MRQKGSYTVEAALLMGILLSVLVSVIYLGFWYHDRNFLQNAAYEAACTASLRADDESYQISGAARSLTEGRMLGTSALSADCQNTENKATVFYRGTFQIPGMIETFFQKNQLKNILAFLSRLTNSTQSYKGVVGSLLYSIEPNRIRTFMIRYNKQ